MSTRKNSEDLFEATKLGNWWIMASRKQRLKLCYLVNILPVTFRGLLLTPNPGPIMKKAVAIINTIKQINSEAKYPLPEITMEDLLAMEKQLIEAHQAREQEDLINAAVYYTEEEDEDEETRNIGRNQ